MQGKLQGLKNSYVTQFRDIFANFAFESDFEYEHMVHGLTFLLVNFVLVEGKINC